MKRFGDCTGPGHKKSAISQMKRILLITLICCMAIPGYSQNSIFGFFGGIGASTSFNYDAGAAGGITFLKQGKGRSGIGADLFYQGYALKYDNEANGIKNGTGVAGVTILDQTSYMFLTPKIAQTFGHYGTLEAYLSCGVGFKVGGTEIMRKWDHSNGYGYGNYDSTIDSSPNLNSMVFRIGFGLKEYIYLGGKWWFTVTEDFGVMPSSITKSSDPHDPSRTPYSPAGKLNPYFLSIFIGLSHTGHVYPK
jgi:hypothetical protein